MSGTTQLGRDRDPIQKNDQRSLQGPQQRPQHPPHWKPTWSERRPDLKGFNEVLEANTPFTPAQKKALNAAKDFFNLLPREACVGEGLKGCYAREHKQLFNDVGTKGGGVIRAGEMVKYIELLQLRNDGRERREIQVDEQEKQRLAAFHEAFSNVPANFAVYPPSRHKPVETRSAFLAPSGLSDRDARHK